MGLRRLRRRHSIRTPDRVPGAQPRPRHARRRAERDDAGRREREPAEVRQLPRARQHRPEHRHGASPSAGLPRVVATWRVQCAPCALSVLGRPIPSPDISGPRLWALLNRLSMPGALTPHSRRLSPVWLSDATTKRSARERWSAVDPFALRDCQRGIADVIVDIRPARALDGGPCEWCGTRSAYGRRGSEAWPGDGLCVTCWITKRDGGS